MAIWFNKQLTIDMIKPIGHNTMTDHLGIEWVELGEDYISAKMPVDHRTNQPYGLLHGGASCVLAETVGSVGSSLVIDHSKYYCVGLEINANHIRGIKTGYVTGTAKPLHLGNSTQVWEIRITSEEGKLICVSRLTMAIVPRKKE